MKRFVLRTYSTKYQIVAGGEEIVRSNRVSKLTEVPLPTRVEDFKERFHENTDNLQHDWPAEIRGIYRDLLKSIMYQKVTYRMGVPEPVVRKNIRKMFEEGPKLTDPAALRLRLIKASQEMEEYFQYYFQGPHIVGRYNCIDPHETLRKDIERSAGPTQGAYRFFNEGKNVLTEHGMGSEDVTENKVYIVREEAYKKGLAAMSAKDLVAHFAPALDKANAATLQVLPKMVNLDKVFEAAAAACHQEPHPSAEDFVARCAAFHKNAGLKQNKPIGFAVKLAWEKFKNNAANIAVLTHPAYKSLIADPKRHVLLRGAADCVRMNLPNGDPETLSKVNAHLYYSDQLPETWGEDLNISYLADLKGIDRKLDLLLDEEIAFRQEQLLRIYAFTVECMKATLPQNKAIAQARAQLEKGESVSVDGIPSVSSLAEFDDAVAGLVQQQLDNFDWSAFTVSASTPVDKPYADSVLYL